MGSGWGSVRLSQPQSPKASEKRLVSCGLRLGCPGLWEELSSSGVAAVRGQGLGLQNRFLLPPLCPFGEQPPPPRWLCTDWGDLVTGTGATLSPWGQPAREWDQWSLTRGALIPSGICPGPAGH